MHAYNRMEADQTDSIAVCATKGEWAVIAAVLDGGLDYAALADDLVSILETLGVTY